jgi:uncharacterized membrane protein YbhN (UPF0104 family)
VGFPFLSFCNGGDRNAIWYMAQGWLFFFVPASLLSVWKLTLLTVVHGRWLVLEGLSLERAPEDRGILCQARGRRNHCECAGVIITRMGNLSGMF